MRTIFTTGKRSGDYSPLSTHNTPRFDINKAFSVYHHTLLSKEDSGKLLYFLQVKSWLQTSETPSARGKNGKLSLGRMRTWNTVEAVSSKALSSWLWFLNSHLTHFRIRSPRDLNWAASTGATFLGPQTGQLQCFCSSDLPTSSRT